MTKLFSGRFAAVSALFAISMLLAACGGGGGTTPTQTCTNGASDYPTCTPPAKAPTATLSSMAPASGETGVKVTVKPTITLAVTDVSGSDATKLSFLCNQKAITFLAASTVAGGVSTSVLTPSASLTHGESCTISGDITSTGAGGSVKTPISMSFTVEQAPVAWWPPAFVPQGTKVYLDSMKAPQGAVVNATYPGEAMSGLLPALCKKVGDACWQEATKNGTIKFVETGAIDTTAPNEKIVFAFYRTVSTILFPGQNKVLYCERPLLAKDGTYGATPDNVENRCNQSEEVFFVGNAEGGIILENNAGVNTCWQNKFVQTPVLGWTVVMTTCP